ncbi:MAG: hypothetical protein ACK532_18930, partial [Acidobacteriota bacterium]
MALRKLQPETEPARRLPAEWNFDRLEKDTLAAPPLKTSARSAVFRSVLVFEDNTAVHAESLGDQLDEIAAALLQALEAEPALHVCLISLRAGAGAHGPGGGMSHNRLESTALALERRGVPRALMELRAVEAFAPEVSTHSLV